MYDPKKWSTHRCSEYKKFIERTIAQLTDSLTADDAKEFSLRDYDEVRRAIKHFKYNKAVAVDALSVELFKSLYALTECMSADENLSVIRSIHQSLSQYESIIVR